MHTDLSTKITYGTSLRVRLVSATTLPFYYYEQNTAKARMAYFSAH